jgi:hypothetical protein
MSAEDFFAGAELTLLAVLDAGDAPASWTITSALYLHLDDSADWRAHAKRAEYGGEPARPLYGVPVQVEPGAHHAWKLRSAAGETWDERGRVIYHTPCPPAAAIDLAGLAWPPSAAASSILSKGEARRYAGRDRYDRKGTNVPAPPPPIAATRTGLDDPGRTIVRKPAAIAQRIASLVWQTAGGEGFTVAELGEQLPAFSAGELAAAIEVLPDDVALVDGRVRRVERD